MLLHPCGSEQTCTVQDMRGSHFVNFGLFVGPGPGMLFPRCGETAFVFAQHDLLFCCAAMLLYR